MRNKPKLGLFDFSMIMVSFVIGMGIFRTPVNVAANSASPTVFFAAWIAGGLIAICGALTYAEIGSRYPVTGGYYKIFSYAYHPAIAFGVNCIILVSNAASLAGVALIGADYISRFAEISEANIETAKIAIAVSAILIFYGINLMGLRMSAKTQNVLTIVKILLLLVLISPLFFYTTPETGSYVASGVDPTFIEYIKGFGLGLVAVSFTCGGYQQSINFGEEVNNPARNIPRGIIIGLCIIIVLYLSVNYAYYKVIGFEELKTAENIAAIMATHVFGSVAGKVLSVLLFLSVLAYVNVLLMSNPRVMQAMGEERVLPAVFARRTEKTNVLVVSLSVFAGLCTLIVFWAKTFDQILSFAIFLDCIGMALSAATIFKLRKETSNLDGTGIYKMGLYPLLPLIFIAAYSFVFVVIFIDDPKLGAIGLGILAVFIGLYFLIKEFEEKGRSHKGTKF